MIRVLSDKRSRKTPLGNVWFDEFRHFLRPSMHFDWLDCDRPSNSAPNYHQIIVIPGNPVQSVNEWDTNQSKMSISADVSANLIQIRDDPLPPPTPPPSPTPPETDAGRNRPGNLHKLNGELTHGRVVDVSNQHYRWERKSLTELTS